MRNPAWYFFLILALLPVVLCRSSIEEVTSSSHGRHLSAIACRDVVIKDGVFKGIIVTDKVWKKAKRNLQRLFDCLPDRGVLAFNTTTTIIPRGTTFIEEPVTVTSLASQIAKQDEEIPESGLEALRIQFGCPTDDGVSETLFDIQSSNVTLDSLTIQGCPKLDLSEAVISIEGQTNLRNIAIRDVKRSKATSKTAPIISIAKDAVVTVSDSSFLGNQGGVLGIGENARITVSRVDFSGNRFEKGKGGAIDMKAGGTVTFSDVSFSENVGGEAGAVYVIDSDVQADRTEFRENKGTTGGAIHVEAKEAKVIFACQSCSFIQNSASKLGGGVFIAGDFDGGDLSFKKTTFNQDNAELAGGALHFNGTGKVEIEESDFFGCEGAKRGGAIDMLVKNGTIDISLLNVNITESKSERGGAMHLEGRVHLAVNGLVSCVKNIAKRLGGAFFLKGGASLTGNGVSFAENSAERGGAIFAQTKEEDLNIDIALEEATFTDNAANSGGALALSGESVVATFKSKTSFSGNKATETGGAITATNGARVDLISTDFVSNFAGVAGGSIALDSLDRDVPVVLNATDVQIVGGTVESDGGDSEGGIGGGLSIAGFATVTIKRVTFRENKSKNLGGAISAIGDSLDPDDVDILLEISEGQFIENTSGDGGALALSGAVDCLLAGAANSTMSFTRNTAKSGAGIYARDVPQVTVRRAKFVENLSSGGPGGGAIRVEGDDRKSTVSLASVEFIQNEVQGNTSLGGGVYASGSLELILDDVQFSGNSAGDQGSALKLVNGAELSIENIRFAGMCITGGS